jgi:undecaprenyl-diphosphatase
MNPFDLGIIHFLNAFAHRSEGFDSFVVFLVGSDLLKGGVLMALFWGAWVSRGTDQPERRQALVFGLITSALSVFVARALAVSLPFRVRPLQNPFLDFRLPYSVDPSALIGWSSFPSDHAVLFFGLATTLYMVSKRLGILAFLQAFFIVCLPRVYTGIHYPSDIIAGAVLGCAIASLAGFATLRARVTRPALHWMEKYPASFYASLFLCTFEVAELFNTVRIIAHPGVQMVKAALQTLR